MLNRIVGRFLAILVMGTLLAFSGQEQAAARGRHGPRALPPVEAWRKARCDGKYEMLLRHIKVPDDVKKYGEFHDLGQRVQPTYAGFKDLPPGHWVYVYPDWYIWRDTTTVPRVKRNWGDEQATGEPDTPGAGDIVTAWASASSDGSDEWLMLEYAEPVVPTAVLVHETYNPGALVRVTVFRLDGEEVEVWQGKDPTPVGSGRGVSEVKFKVGFKTTRVRLHIASTKVAGWNEIDAVGLRDSNGKIQWAKSASASSVYGVAVAVPRPPPPPPRPPVVPPRPAPNPREQRIKQLEQELEGLKKEIKDLKEVLRKRDK